MARHGGRVCRLPVGCAFLRPCSLGRSDWAIASTTRSPTIAAPSVTGLPGCYCLGRRRSEDAGLAARTTVAGFFLAYLFVYSTSAPFRIGDCPSKRPPRVRTLSSEVPERAWQGVEAAASPGPKVEHVRALSEESATASWSCRGCWPPGQLVDVYDLAAGRVCQALKSLMYCLMATSSKTIAGGKYLSTGRHQAVQGVSHLLWRLFVSSAGMRDAWQGGSAHRF